MRKHEGWFRTDTTRGGRTVREQLLGLGPALAEAPGKTVLDLGCAEGWIGVEFARAGAARIDGLDSNAAFVADARDVAARHAPGVLHVAPADLNAGLPADLPGPWDLVLALAVLHKLNAPAAALDWLCAATAGLLVVRLPLGSQGELRPKHGNLGACDLRTALPPRGFAMEREQVGPQTERVQYWRRRA